MSVETVYAAEPLNIMPAAVQKVQQLVQEEENPELMLRVFVTGGGCAGFQYGFTFDEEPAEDDTIIEKSGVRFVIDSLSVQYIGGSTVGYTEGLEGSKFILENPSAETTCGCGSSFSI